MKKLRKARVLRGREGAGWQILGMGLTRGSWRSCHLGWVAISTSLPVHLLSRVEISRKLRATVQLQLLLLQQHVRESRMWRDVPVWIERGRRKT